MPVVPIKSYLPPVVDNIPRVLYEEKEMECQAKEETIQVVIHITNAFIVEHLQTNIVVYIVYLYGQYLSVIIVVESTHIKLLSYISYLMQHGFACHFIKIIYFLYAHQECFKIPYSNFKQLKHTHS